MQCNHKFLKCFQHWDCKRLSNVNLSGSTNQSLCWRDHKCLNNDSLCSTQYPFSLQPFQNIWLMRFCNSSPLFYCAYAMNNCTVFRLVHLPRNCNFSSLCCCQTLVYKLSSLKNMFLYHYMLHLPTAYPLLKGALLHAFKRQSFKDVT